MRAVAYRASGECIPWYGLYSLLFADHGLSTAQISSLFVIWSVTGFVLEVPSGAWADTVSRRGLLILSGLLLAAGFACWTVVPNYAGFAAGFVLWGVAGALMSGTFEALLYDELTARHASVEYPRVMGYATGTAEAAVLAGILAGTPLYHWGGYPAVGWVSVGFALLHTGLAATLPAAPKAASASADFGELAEEGTTVAAPVAAATRPLARYLSMLRTGVGEVARVPVVLRGVLLTSLLSGFTAFDEYFGLLAEESGTATGTIPLLVGLAVVGSVAGTLVAGRTAGVRAGTMAVVLSGAAVSLAGGALVGGVLGFAVIGVAYGAIYNGIVISEARLQDAIEGPARATVTSVSGLIAELVALAVFGIVTAVTLFAPMSVAIAVLGIPVLAAAIVVPRWLPPR